MVHWSLLIVTFVLGVGVCYFVLYRLSRVYSGLLEGFRQAAGKARFE